MRSNIVAATLIVIALINLTNLVTGISTAPYEQVGPKDVSVTEPYSGEKQLVPVLMRSVDRDSNLKSTDSGRRVSVYLRVGYLDSDRLTFAILSLSVALIGGIAYWAAPRIWKE